MNKKDEIIWNNVLRLIKEKGMKKTEVARLAGTRPQVLTNIQKGRSGIGARLLTRFARALGVSEADLMKEHPYDEENQHLYDSLKVILKSGDAGVIEAISSDLREYSKAVQQQKEIERLKKRISLLHAKLETIKQKIE